MQETRADFKTALSQALPPEFAAVCQKLDVQYIPGDSVTGIINALKHVGSLDFDDYVHRYQDIGDSGIDPIWHFFNHGIWEGRKITIKKNVHYIAENIVLNQAPLITVLVPVYNNAMYLPECFDSILTQTWKNIEVIIIDDGSTDPEAIKIMKDYASRDYRVKLIRKANSGYGHTMNVGLSSASGKYVAIVESDDYIEKTAIERMYEICDTNCLDFVKTDFERFFGDKPRRFVHAEVFKDKSKYNKVLNSMDFSARYYDIVNVIWNALYRREFLTKNGIRFNETPGASFQDNGFYFQVYIHARRFMLSEISTYRLRRDNAGSSFYSNEKMFAIWNEYEFIYRILLKNPELYHSFIKVYHYKKFINLFFSLAHVKEGEENIILDKFRSDFLKARDKEELDKDIFGNGYKKLLAILKGDYAKVIPPKPELSIILTVYNKEKYLAATMDSILNQTFNDFELIIVDDGSRDGSVGIINQYAKDDQRIKLFVQANKGPGSARNTGLKNAAGKYVIILDADDTVYPEFCGLLLENIKRHDADFCVCESESLNELTGDVTKINYALNWYMLPPKPCFSPEEIKGNIFRAFCGWAWDKIYKKSFLDQAHIVFPDVSFSEDLVFVLAAVAKARKVSVINKILIRHRHFVTASVSNTRDDHPLDFIDALEFLCDFLKSNGIYEKFKKDFLSYALHHYNWNITTLSGKSVQRVANKKDYFARCIGIYDHSRDYYYDKGDYDMFIAI